MNTEKCLLCACLCGCVHVFSCFKCSQSFKTMQVVKYTAIRLMQKSKGIIMCKIECNSWASMWLTGYHVFLALPGMGVRKWIDGNTFKYLITTKLEKYSLCLLNYAWPYYKQKYVEVMSFFANLDYFHVCFGSNCDKQFLNKNILAIGSPAHSCNYAIRQSCDSSAMQKIMLIYV